MNKKKVFAAGLALAVLFGGQATQSFAASPTNPVQIASADYTYSDQATKALNHLNDIRAKMGLQAVKLNPFLTKAAENHANYLAINNQFAHEEDSTKKGFTGVDPWDRVGAVGGSKDLVDHTWEIISYDKANAADAIDEFLTTAYHREPLMNPDATDIGVGIVGKYVVMEIVALGQTKQVSVYPYDGQINVGIGFYGFENPNPLEKFGVKKSGQIITFKAPYVLRSIDVTLTNSKGENIPYFTPLKDGGYWHIIPKSELAYDEKYTVSVTYSPYIGSDEGKVFTKTWSFTTESDPKSASTGKDKGSDSNDSSSTYNPTPADSVSAIKYSSNNIGIKINGKYVAVNPKAKIVNESTFIPLRGVFEAIGAEVKWHGEDQSIDITKGNTKVHLQIGNKKATVNGKEITLATAPFISEEGSTYVPLRFASEALGAKVGWDGENWTAVIDIN